MTASPTTSQETIPAEPLRFANVVEVTAAGTSDGMVYVTFYAHVPDPDTGDYHRETVTRLVVPRGVAALMQRHLARQLELLPDEAPRTVEAGATAIHLAYDPVLRAIWENDDDTAYDEL